MSGSQSFDDTPVAHKRQLINWFEAGCKPASQWRVGTEHEKFLFHLNTLAPVTYEGENGINMVLYELQAFKWEPVIEGDHVIALKRGAAAISLEPGGQFELSGAPFATLHETADELAHHMDEMGSVCRLLGLGALGLGFHPTAKREDVPWMPKARYQIMRSYMPKRGSLGLDMMLRTCTVQANLDYSSEKDMVAKMRVAMALQPVVVALFANSPLRDGNLSGDLSFRARVWQHTDPDRCGHLEFVFHPDFNFESYTDYALNVPMYFVRRDGQYIDVAGASFKDFMQGKLSALPGDRPTMGDWADHLSTLFPNVRLKQYLEMRGADMGNFEMTLALPALWTGLLYDSDSLAACLEIINRWIGADRTKLNQFSPRLRLGDMAVEGSVRALGQSLLKIAFMGLRRRAKSSFIYDDEAVYLQPLAVMLERGISQAEAVQRLFCDDWNNDATRLFPFARLL